MRSDLQKLRAISMDDFLCTLLETIIIEDDCKKLDPWTFSEFPPTNASYDIWPRNDMGTVITSEIAIVGLTTILRERKLCPKTIRIRDYRIAQVNLHLSPEMTHVRDLVKDSVQGTSDPGSVAAVARNLVDGAHLAMKSLIIRSASMPLPRSSVIHSSRFKDGLETAVLGEPKISEAVIELSPEYQGRETDFSMLRSAELLLGLEATSYWLEHLFYKATTLSVLALSIKSPWGPCLNAKNVVPRLTDFSLSHTTISAAEILAMIISSKESLKDIRFRQVTLHDGSTWHELLSFIASEQRALSSFSLAVLRENAKGHMAIDFKDMRNDSVIEEYLPGLSLIEKGSSHNRRITTLSYDGPNAGSVLGIISRHAQTGTCNES